MVGVKDLVNPGGRQDDEVLYGSGRNNDPFHNGSTTGSVTSASKYPTSNDPTTTSTSSNPAGSTTTTTTTTTNPPSTHPHGYGKESGVTGAGHGSAVNPHPFSSHGLGVVEPTSTSGTPGMFDDGATTASIKSGVTGKAQGGSLTNLSGTHKTSGSSKPLSEPSAHAGSTHTAGPHSSALANRADPRVDSDRDGHKGLGTSTAGTGSGLTSSSLPDRSVEGSGYGRDQPNTSGSSHLGRDAAIAAGALGAGTAAHDHSDRKRDGTYGDTSNPSQLGRNAAIEAGALGAGTAAHHNDRDRDGTYRDTSNTSHFGRDVAIGAGALGAGTAAHHHSDRDRDGIYGNTSNPSHLGRDAAIGAGAVGAGTAAHHHHDREWDGTHVNPSDSSHLGRDGAIGAGALGAAHHHNDRDRHGIYGDTSNPSHLGRDAAIGAGAVGAGTAAHHHHDRERDGTHVNPSDPSHLGCDTVIGGGVLGAGTAAHHHPDRERDVAHTDTSNPSHLGRDAAIGASALGVGTSAHHHHDRQQDGTYAAATIGPNSSTLANKADPRVDRDLSGPRYAPTSTSGPGLPSSLAGAYGATTAGPHSSNLANKVDPRVDSDRDGSVLGGNTRYGSGTGHVGGDGPHLTHGPHVTDTANRLDPHVDPITGKHVKATHAEFETLPGLVGGETGSAGSTRVAGGFVTGSDHHIGPTDSTIAHDPTGPSNTASSHHHTGPTEPTSHTTGPVHKSALLNKLDPRVKTESSTHRDTAGTVSSNPADHTGRDLTFSDAGGIAGLKGATKSTPHGTNVLPTSAHAIGTGSRDISGPAGVSGAATYETQKHHDRHDPSGTTPSSTHSEFGHVNPDKKTGHHHRGRDAALGGAATVTGAEFSKKEAEKVEKEHDRDVKKEIKAHEKEKKHEKTLEKDDKKHHDDGKKHGGILGLFHRDKTDKHEKEIEEPKHKDKTNGHEAEAVVGAGAIGAGLADHHKHEHGKLHEDPVSEKYERNRLHKDPPAGYGEVPQRGYASQVTGGTGTTALAQGQSVPRGSHLSGLGNDLDPNVPARGSSTRHNEPIEPHTGLPIDLSKGARVWGTDESSAPGYHAPGRGLTGETTGHVGSELTGGTSGHSGSGVTGGTITHGGSGLTGGTTDYSGSGLTDGTTGHSGSGVTGATTTHGGSGLTGGITGYSGSRLTGETTGHSGSGVTGGTTGHGGSGLTGRSTGTTTG